MGIIINILVLILMMGFLILIHELGHFLWAKKFGVYIYEFSIGMGPVLKTIKGKDGINYSIRAFPIGGFVQMAGEVYEDDNEIPKEKFMCNKPWWQRLIILLAGVTNNFICALLLFFVIACFYGAPTNEPIIDTVTEDFPFAEAGIVPGDKIISVNDKKTKTWDKVQILLIFKSKDDVYKIGIEHDDGSTDTYDITPKATTNEDGKEAKVFGVSMKSEIKRGFLPSLKYAFTKFGSLVNQMMYTIGGLFTGKLSVNSLSGPVGIYSIVGSTIKTGLANIIYLVAFLSLNLGFVNVLPFPAFDGGRVLFILIEKIIRRPIDSKIENAFHSVGFILIMLLMFYITIHDIIKLF